MDSLFEINVKSVCIKGDASSLYIYRTNSLILKVRYSIIKSILKFAVEKVYQLDEAHQIQNSSFEDVKAE